KKVSQKRTLCEHFWDILCFFSFLNPLANQPRVFDVAKLNGLYNHPQTLPCGWRWSIVIVNRPFVSSAIGYIDLLF
ncbi:hypothetical protein ACSYHE_15160, partial [Geobacillus thermodenitrificans subsp. calidus]